MQDGQPIQKVMVVEILAAKGEPMTTAQVKADANAKYGLGTLTQQSAGRALLDAREDGAVALVGTEPNTWALAKKGGGVMQDSSRQAQCLRVVKDAKQPVTSADVSNALGYPKGNKAVTNSLSNLATAGRIKRIGKSGNFVLYAPNEWNGASAPPQARQPQLIGEPPMTREQMTLEVFGMLDGWINSPNLLVEVTEMGYDWKPRQIADLPLNRLWQKGWITRRKRADGGPGYEYKLADEAQRETLPPLGRPPRRRKASNGNAAPAPEPQPEPPKKLGFGKRVKLAWAALLNSA